MSEIIKKYFAGLIGIPLIFDGSSLCPECLYFAMNVAGSTWICEHCGSTFPGTVFADKYGLRWLQLNDAL